MKKLLAISTLLVCMISIFPKEALAATLSKNDALFREDIQYRLGTKTQTKIYGMINGYKAKIAKMDAASANALTDSIIAKVDRILYLMSAAESNDKQLAKRASAKYQAYMLIKLELMLLK